MFAPNARRGGQNAKTSPIRGTKGKAACDGAFATSFLVSPETVAARARARWKIENGSFKVCKNRGCRLDHNFGSGKRHLATMFAAMNSLAFAFHTVSDCLSDLWTMAGQAKRARKRFFEHLRTIAAYLVFPSWETLMTTLIDSKPPPEIEQQTGA